MVTKQTPLNKLADMAQQATREVDNEEKFRVKDLFRGFEWNRVAKGNRTKLGAMFLAHVTSGGIPGVAPEKNSDGSLKKTPQNQQIYIKL
ncbi:hypothetical protein SDC9_64968 [bioreactor metagenome]|uniref:DUF1413 domain-containing protein n=1 Tax=bioreactor metagenome TaxID=1076179 RepID=A0A644XQR9_9ZZZZ